MCPNSPPEASKPFPSTGLSTRFPELLGGNTKRETIEFPAVEDLGTEDPGALRKTVFVNPFRPCQATAAGFTDFIFSVAVGTGVKFGRLDNLCSSTALSLDHS